MYRLWDSIVSHKEENIMRGEMAERSAGRWSRRRFLGGAIAVGAIQTGVLGSAAALAAEERWAMRLSGSTINFTALPIEQACERLAALGFEAVDVWSAHANCPHLDDVQTRLKAEGLKAILARLRLKLSSSKFSDVRPKVI